MNVSEYGSAPTREFDPGPKRNTRNPLQKTYAQTLKAQLYRQFPDMPNHHKFVVRGISNNWRVCLTCSSEWDYDFRQKLISDFPKYWDYHSLIALGLDTSYDDLLDILKKLPIDVRKQRIMVQVDGVHYGVHHITTFTKSDTSDTEITLNLS